MKSREERAEELRADAKRLVEEAEALNKAADILAGLRSESKSTYSIKPIKKEIPRSVQLRNFMTKSGPLHLKDILVNSGIPRGTATTLLHERNGYRKTSDGRWYYPSPGSGQETPVN